MSKRILLLSVSAGAGHVRAAEALRSAALARNEGLEIRHLDVMDYVTSGFRKLYTDFYIRLVNKAPVLWGYLYNFTNERQTDSTLNRLRARLERMNVIGLLREIREFRPDAVICTHFLPTEILSRLKGKGKFDVPVWVQVTDFDLHKMWVHKHIDGYFAGNEEVAFRMRAQGIAAERIHVTGIPVMPAFGQALQREVCAPEFGLDPQRLTLLLMGGGAGLGSLDAVAQSLLALKGDAQLIVMAGKNASALAALQKLAERYPGRLFPQGFTGQVERLMACADLAITKPGGLTTSECLAVGLPMIVNAPIPGQEERNADFLLENGAALKACDEVTLEYRVQFLLRHPEALEEMRRKTKALGRPGAANAALGIVLKNAAATNKQQDPAGVPA
jgi:processive 1,2-diacylglycerol beta-glucosyltransferase